MSSPKKIKVIILFIGLLLVLAIVGYFIWWSLPVTINRRSDIKFGNELITKIEQHKSQHGLPQTNDWQTLRQLGFKQRGDLLIPDYQKLNDTTFELVYLEDFAGPCLLWNSLDRQWKKAMLTHFKDNHTEENVVGLVEQTSLYKDKSKIVDSLSSGKHGLNLIVTMQDTAKNIYLVKAAEDNGNSSVTYFNFLIDANKMIILNPTGKLEGQ